MVTVVIIDPPVKKGGIAFSSSRTAVEGADAGGTQHLVAGKDGKVHVQGLQVKRQMGRGLAGVQHHQRAGPVGQVHQGLPPD